VADEWVGYLDPDYTPDTGTDVAIYLKEGIGLVFALSFDISSFLHEAGYSVSVGGRSRLDLTVALSELTATFVHAPFEYTFIVTSD